MRNISALGYDSMTEAEQAAWAAENEKPYLALNGHKMQAYPQYLRGGRPVYSSAWTTCTEDCPACDAGEPLPDW